MRKINVIEFSATTAVLMTDEGTINVKPGAIGVAGFPELLPYLDQPQRIRFWTSESHLTFMITGGNPAEWSRIARETLGRVERLEAWTERANVLLQARALNAPS